MNNYMQQTTAIDYTLHSSRSAIFNTSLKKHKF